MVRKLYRVTRGNIMEWHVVDLIMQASSHVDALMYAVDQHWIEVSPGLHSVRLTVEGWRVVQ